MYRLAVFGVLAFLINISAHADNVPVTEPIEIVKAWIPIGFDSNDRTQVLIDGILPSTCFRVGPYTTHVDPLSKTISVQQNMDGFLGLCLQMIIPFTQTIEIGVLMPGSYTLVDQTSGRTLGTLPVARATSENIDDYLYANVQDCSSQKDTATGRATVSCSFELPNRCTRFEKAIVNYYPDAVVMQPVLARIGGKACGDTLERAMFSVPLKGGLKGTYLLHVRSMNGKSISKLINIE